MSVMLAEPMAKKSAAKGAAPKGDQPARKPMVVQIRGSEEYKAWVESVARKKGFSVAVLFDQALRHFVADELGPPPER